MSAIAASPIIVAILLMLLTVLTLSTKHVSAGRNFGVGIELVVGKNGHGNRDGNDTAEADLEFYAHVNTQGPGLAVLLPAVDTNTTASFGQIQAFALNVTAGPDASTSQFLGVMHGYTVQTSYAPSQSRAVEVEVLSYDDGAGVNGTINLQGLILSSGQNTISIVGGTGSFAGVRGYDVISTYNATSATTHSVYHHSLYFL